jgi:phosphatidylglycerophosphatase A
VNTGTGLRLVASRQLAPRWARVTATFFGAGKLRPGPGTWGSLAGLAVWCIIAGFITPGWQTALALGGACIITAVGIPAATRVAREMGKEDPSCIVVDEVAGQWIALAGVPLHWKTVLAAFILFRAFDIMKPPPIRQLERLPQGFGIMLDDIGAGIYALVVMRLLLRSGVLS